MDEKLIKVVLNDCNDVLHNVCDTSAEAEVYWCELERMARVDGKGEMAIYDRLREMTEEIYENS
jgi:hypothetical protein